MQRYNFQVWISGDGNSPDEAWEDAVACFTEDPGAYDDSTYTTEPIPDGGEPEPTGPMITVTFRPQAWQNDWAVSVDPEGPTTWQVPVSRLAGVSMETYASDHLRHDPQAPKWCKNWPGPFEVEWDQAEVDQAVANEMGF